MAGLFSEASFAQDNRSSDTDAAIAAAEDAYGPPPPMEDCSDEQEAAILTGEIIVCRRKRDQSQFRVSSEDEAESRYARETMNAGDPRAPDVAGPGIFRGPATVSGLCFIPPCPPPPAYMIDFDELPETPPGSDAERAGQGLAPRGNAPSDTNEELAD
ncbi:hypothetical protein [Altererythrobacter sp. MF3-039]|uniref:hypothetical protein n=1 Tax=Altererythrobacter sp. MF3-039 TaxID=3252901 RepID=UPI00390CA402